MPEITPRLLTWYRQNKRILPWRDSGNPYAVWVSEIVNPLGEIRHAYTHFKITEYAYACTMLGSSQKENLRWVDLEDLNDYPMGKVDREIAKRLTS